MPVRGSSPERHSKFSRELCRSYLYEMESVYAAMLRRLAIAVQDGL